MNPVHPVHKRSVWALIAFVLVCGSAVRAEAPITAEQVIGKAEETFRGLSDYECRIESESRLGSKVETSELRFRYKQPGLVRCHVLSGHGRGSDVVVAADGKVRARDGGLFKPFVITLSKNDSRLKSIRGVALHELVWGTYYQQLRDRIRQPAAHVTLSPHPDAEKPYELLLTYPEAGHRVREIYHFDPHLWVMVDGDVFEDQVRVDHVAFREIRLNPGLKDSLFRL